MMGDPVFLVYCSGDDLDYAQLDQVYLESSLENASSWHPELTPEDALAKYERGHHAYLENEFFPQGGMLMLLKQEHYVCALRLYPLEADRFYIEALETRPDARNRGYAKMLLQEMTLYLTERSCVCTVRSHVSKRNLASLRAHASAGFHAETDYVMEDGVRDGSRVSLLWDNAQLSRISRFEKIYDHLAAPDAIETIPEDQFRAELSCLDQYYSSRLWRIDFEADEKGILPQRLKRGVLSEDAIYLLLTEYQELLKEPHPEE